MKHLFIISGPSGSGKTTVGNILEDRYNIHECISTTTRNKRVGEEEGVNYYFLKEEEFLDELNKGSFIETNLYAGNYYGLSLKAVEDAFLKNKDLAFVIAERKGAKQIIDFFKDEEEVITHSIFFKINLEIMAERMKDRGDGEEAIKKRINNAIQISELDVPEISNFVIDANQDLEEVVSDFCKIIKQVKKA